MAADELILAAPEAEPALEVAEVPTLVLVGVALLVMMMLEPVMMAPLPIVESVVQDEDAGMGWAAGVLVSP